MKRKRWDEVLDRLPADRPFALTEVGVWKGVLAERLLRARPLVRLTLVDPWRAGDDNPSWHASGSTMARESQKAIDEFYRRVENLAHVYPGRVTILRMPSIDAAAHVGDGSMDAVFIDADHSRDAVAADIDAWWPKVRAAGWIGGHDYDHPRFPGVKQAVDAVFSQVEGGADRCWFVRL